MEVGLGIDTRPELLEKPASKDDNLRMLLDLNGNVCEVVTGVSLGMPSTCLPHCSLWSLTVYPILTAPGYAIK